MQNKVTTVAGARPESGGRSARGPEWRESLREQALDSALRKRAAGVPTYSVPEAAALLSISYEYLLRLIQADAFPAVRMRTADRQGRYIVPAKAVDRLLGEAAAGPGVVEAVEFTQRWQAGAVRGAAS